MLKVLLLLFFSYLSVYPQQWINQNVSFSNYNISAIEFLSDEVGFLAMGPEIWKTNDGGITLNKIYESEPPMSNSFHFDDFFRFDSIIIAAARDRIVIYNYSLGTFQETLLPISGRVSFVNLNFGWLQSSSKLFKTNNLGGTWIEVKLPTLSIANIYFLDSLNGFYTAELEQGIYKTTDGGNIWNYLDAGINVRNGTINFFNNGIGFIQGLYQYLYTTNGGITWTQKSGLSPNIICRNIGINTSQPGKQGYFTLDYGESWNKLQLPINRHDMVLYAVNDSLYLCGHYKGSLYRSTDQGKNWTCVTKVSEIFQQGFFLDENRGWVVGDNLMRTTDGGNTWKFIFTSNYLHYIFFKDETRGFAIVSDFLLHSTNAGESWDTLFFIEDYFRNVNQIKIYFITPQKGFILGNYNLFARTTDGGLTWDFNNSQNISGTMSFPDSINGFISSTTTGFRTYDGGLTWIEKPSLKGRWPFFLDSLNGWKNLYYEGPPLSYLQKTTDGGDTFFTISSSQNPYSIKFFNTTMGINIDYNSRIHNTSDGGYTWKTIFEASSFYQYYFNATFISPTIGWVYGERGAIYKYQSVVPVEFSTFKITQEGNLAILRWNTSTEKNNRGFEIERRIAEGTWTTRSFIPGAGTTLEPREYSFIDELPVSGKYKYRLKQIDFDGSFEYSESVEVNFSNYPAVFSLQQNYPNPFNSSTIISYSVPHPSQVIIKLHDILGNEIETLVNEEKPAGSYEIIWNAENLPSSVYFYQIRAGNFVHTKKMTLMK